MHTSSLAGSLALAVVLGVAGGPVAFAACSGAAAPVALGAFNKAPVEWLAYNKGKGDIGAKAEALAAAAVNSGDADFGKSLSTVLALASGDDGAAIGSSLGGLVNTCSDPKDPGDQADKRYITANIERNLLVNSAANTAYGQRGGPETAAASTSAGGGAGGSSAGTSSGTGTVGSGIPTGGSNSGAIPDGSATTANAIGVLGSGTVPTSSFSGTSTVSSPEASTLSDLTQAALNSAAGSGTGSNLLLCYGSLNICGNSGNVTFNTFEVGGNAMSTTSLIR